MALRLVEIGTIVGVALVVAIAAGYKVWQSWHSGLINEVRENNSNPNPTGKLDDLQDAVNSVDETVDKIDENQEGLQETVDHLDDRIDDIGHAIFEIHKDDPGVNRQALSAYTGVSDPPSDITQDPNNDD